LTGGWENAGSARQLALPSDKTRTSKLLVRVTFAPIGSTLNSPIAGPMGICQCEHLVRLFVGEHLHLPRWTITGGANPQAFVDIGQGEVCSGWTRNKNAALIDEFGEPSSTLVPIVPLDRLTILFDDQVRGQAREFPAGDQLLPPIRQCRVR
jgi:hypothetical protein